ncbi:hypothetical protein [Hoyosella altamirensis]|uniref:Uncharacterized protein n=1 Tax=Hoyosella altamirensis TaxID=616997 RepID=A0A839RU71_9ACTN|nr:hypothetical protein [Hoyosella altamirensis]MBB3040110.1 hypothetical protein [Hoyosella altamirensis]
MFHQLISADLGTTCVVCGAYWRTDPEHSHCPGSTELVHGYDTSSHSLDQCSTYDTNGDCEHLAIHTGCDCDHCNG